MSSLPYEVVVINLPQSIERRQFIEAELKETALPYRFIEAVDGKKLGSDIEKRIPWWSLWLLGRKLSKGEIGCYLSHLEAAQYLCSSNLEFVVVLEDDVSISPKLSNFCTAMVNEKDWDMIRLERRSNKVFPIKRSVPKLNDMELVRVDCSTFGSAGYALSRAGAHKILRTSNKITWPFDFVIARFWAHGLKLYQAIPAPVTIRKELNSDIDTASARGKARSKLALCTRRARILHDSVMKRIFRRFIRIRYVGGE